MTTEAGSRDPTLTEILRLAMDYELQDLYKALPGRIETYDPVTQKANVKPLIMRKIATDEGEELTEPLPIVTQVKVGFLQAGDFEMSVPVKKGDFCLLLFCDRSIDAYMAGQGDDTDPNDFRIHDISDAYALVGFGPFSKSLLRASADNMVIGHKSGKGVGFFKENQIHWGAETAGDALALASTTDTDLSAIVTSVNAIVALLNAEPALVGVYPLLALPTPVSSAIMKVDS